MIETAYKISPQREAYRPGAPLRDPAYLAWIRSQPCAVEHCASAYIYRDSGRRPIRGISGLELARGRYASVGCCLHAFARFLFFFPQRAAAALRAFSWRWAGVSAPKPFATPRTCPPNRPNATAAGFFAIAHMMA